MSLTLFGLLACADGLHRYISASCPKVGIDVGGVERLALLVNRRLGAYSSFSRGPQQLINAADGFCVAIGMVICVPKTKTSVFPAGMQQHPPWLCKGYPLDYVDSFKYLALLFSIQGSLKATFPSLKQGNFAVWALPKRQYGNHPCSSSVGLLLVMCDVCAPATASYGCEVWACQGFTTSASVHKAALPDLYLQQIMLVRKTVPSDIVWTEFSVQLEVVLWQRTIIFWNSMAAAPANSLCRRIALASCSLALARSVQIWAYAWYFCRGVCAYGFSLGIRIFSDHLDANAEAMANSRLCDLYDARWQTYCSLAVSLCRPQNVLN